ncbi:MAG: hypothetical protein JXA90_11850 [Planctomycetes bacterium]|nr:hypothetical protein [Planctomycetota bacterium]
MSLRCTRAITALAVIAIIACAGAPALARGGWPDIPAVYCYEADEGEDAYVGSFDTPGCLDGEWCRSSNSDQWDGSTPEPGDGAPGGIMVELVPDEGEDGGDASVLTIEDTGDPRNFTPSYPDPGNRKLFLWRDTSDELDLAAGVTLVARWRLSPEAWSTELWGTEPNGTYLHDSSKGQIGFVQKRAAEGILPATLAFAITDNGNLQFAYPAANNPCTGAAPPDEICFDVDEFDWVTVWMAAQETELGTVRVSLYLNGDGEPALEDFEFTPPNDSETTTGTTASYILMALGSTGQNGAIQVDYLCAAEGFLTPSDVSEDCPVLARATAQGKDIVLTWENRASEPTALDIRRDGSPIATGIEAASQTYTDPAVPPGLHDYELEFTVPGVTCTPLRASIDTCPKALRAIAAPTGVMLTWTSGAEYDGLSVSRGGAEIASLAGDATSYLDETAPSGVLTYSVLPAAGSCTPLEATIDYTAVHVGSGDFNSAPADWAYILDPPPDADPEDWLLHDPAANVAADLDGEWSSGNGSDSWDGSAPGEIGDPALDVAGVEDPSSAAPGGIGLVTDGDVGAHLFEDTGNPTTAGWLDPSNRKLYLCYDVGRALVDSSLRSLVSDGLTLRARLRLTPPERAVDVTDAPNGHTLHTDGKGMVVFAHDADTTGAAQDQRIGLVLDVHPTLPGAGVLTIGQADDDRGDGRAASSIVVPVPDPTEWLDIWMTLEDADGSDATPELLLMLYLNGSSEPALEIEDYVPNLQGPEVTGMSVANEIAIGLGSTPESASFELDLVAFIDDVIAPRVGPSPDRFVRGDPDSSGVINITDGIRILSFLFTGGAPLECGDAGDTDNDGQLTITDAIKVFGYLFLGQGAPAAPAPSSPTYAAADCGVDTGGSLGCATRAVTCGGTGP